jgi:uncharacterized membrane protein YeiH
MVTADATVVFAATNVVGLIAFAIVGVLKGRDADLDLFGIVVLGLLTALGGGTLRDVLAGRVPTALQSTSDVSVALLGVVVGVALAAALQDRVDGRLRDHPVLLLPDAVGLAAFAATGALVGMSAALSPFGVVVLATLTAVGGGSLADLLVVRVPAVLREDFYATPAALGGVGFWVAVEAGIRPGRASFVCAGLVLTLRLLALRYDWRLPSL